MRIAGAALLLVGLVAAIFGTFMGCNTLFAWNGRHAIEEQAIPAPTDDAAASHSPFKHQLKPEPGRHYMLSIRVVFDREGLTRKEGVTVVEAKMPLVVQVKDAHGTVLAQASGFLDPNEPPNVLYGAPAHESMRGPMPELVVERLIGPFSVASAEQPLDITIDLGADRIGSANVVARRLVIHDDTIPPAIKNHFIIACAGAASFLTGLILLIVGFFKRKRRKRSV